ncbi:hypothetical protein HRbin36_00674 [bacterium HR36]|nr:hypothetical protein HRbin36_00674 [bacterium HR36]
MPALPLKTVLAYLDDVLDPQQLRAVGAQIAEDQELRQLLERIRYVLRRRDLNLETHPEDELPGAEFIAKYLEGDLPEEAARELEQRCLESDAVLAEVAACHQMLHSGIPTRSQSIPPQSYRRMYRLVGEQGTTGPVQPSRVSTSSETISALPPQERMLLLGLPTVLEGPWSRRLVPIALIMALLLGLVLSLYFALIRPGSPTELARADTAVSNQVDNVPPAEEKKAKPSPAPVGAEFDASQRRTVASGLVLLPVILSLQLLCPGCYTVALLPDEAWKEAAPKPKPVEVSPPVVQEPLDVPAEAERLPAECKPRELATLLGPVHEPRAGNGLLATHAALGIQETLLWRWHPEGQVAQLLKPQERIAAGSRLQVWPGYRATLRLDSGVLVELVGNIPELQPETVLDASLHLHLPEAPYHLDATLERGWFIITGRKDESYLRLRLAGEVWDMVLPPGNTRLFVEVQWRLQLGAEPPTARPFLAFYTAANGVLWRRSQATGAPKIHRVPAQSMALPDAPIQGRLAVDAPQPAAADSWILPYKTLPAWASSAVKPSPTLRDSLATFQRHVFQRALVENPTRPWDGARQALLEQLSDAEPVLQRLAVFGLAAGGFLEDLARVLEHRQQPAIRQAAREALHYWLGQYPQRAGDLRQVLMQKLGYSVKEAELFVELLRGYSGPGRAVAERLLEIMQQEQSPALRYLAVANLRELYPNLRDGYSPDANKEARDKAISAIRKQFP